MKALLTSAGITNRSIANALQDLAGKPLKECHLAFIPTASDIEAGDKGWLIDDLVNFKKQEFKVIDIVDIAALAKSAWLPRLQEADILFFGGGNTFFLLHWLSKSGLSEILPELLKTKVYAGISAGSIAASDEILVSQSKFFEEETGQPESNKGLGLVNFQTRPHLNSPHFPKIRKEFVEQVAKEINKPLYVIDDQTAIQVRDRKVEIISEGEYLSFNLNK